MSHNRSLLRLGASSSSRHAQAHRDFAEYDDGPRSLSGVHSPDWGAAPLRRTLVVDLRICVLSGHSILLGHGLDHPVRNTVDHDCRLVFHPSELN